MPAAKTQPETWGEGAPGAPAVAAARESHQKLPTTSAPAASTPMAPDDPTSHAAGTASATRAIAVSNVTRARNSLMVRFIHSPLGGLHRAKQVHEAGGDAQEETAQHQPGARPEPSIAPVPGA